MLLSPEEIAEFSQLLNERKQKLLEVKSVGEASAETVILDQTRVGRLSRMDAMQAQAMHMETNRRREIELQKIDNALTRIETNDYGYCLVCEEGIALERLKLDPSVTLCIDCASQDA